MPRLIEKTTTLQSLTLIWKKREVSILLMPTIEYFLWPCTAGIEDEGGEGDKEEEDEDMTVEEEEEGEDFEGMDEDEFERSQSQPPLNKIEISEVSMLSRF